MNFHKVINNIRYRPKNEFLENIFVGDFTGSERLGLVTAGYNNFSGL